MPDLTNRLRRWRLAVNRKPETARRLPRPGRVRERPRFRGAAGCLSRVLACDYFSGVSVVSPPCFLR